jgi:hypothetical protein
VFLPTVTAKAPSSGDLLERRAATPPWRERERRPDGCVAGVTVTIKGATSRNVVASTPSESLTVR